jgi:hypothetical protein
MELLKLALIEKVLHVCETGIEFYARMLGSLRRELCLHGFNTNQAHDVILTLLGSKYKK